jgi:hypothetical protein
MSSYQAAKPDASPTGQWLTFRAGVKVSPTTRDWLADKILRHKAKLGTRWRILDPALQATLTLAYLRTNLTYAELAIANGISTTTCWRNINEAIGLLAERAIRLRDVLRLARKRGWEYLLIDVVNVPTVAFGRKISRKQKDITAARHHQLQTKIGLLFGLLTDLGYLGLEHAITGFRRKRGEKELPMAKKVANRIHASLRCLGERGNAQLKWWRVMATELRCRPERCTRMVKAVLTVHYLEHAPLAG